MLNSEVQAKLIKTGRDFTKGYILNDPYEEKFESDQELGLPQPPLVKAPVTPEDSWILLTREFSDTVVKSNIRYATESEYNINRFSKILKNLNIDHKIEFDGKSFIITFTPIKHRGFNIGD